VSAYTDAKGQKEKSQALIDRAIDINKRYGYHCHCVLFTLHLSCFCRYSEGLVIKGSLMLSLGHHKEAAAAYRKAYGLHKDFVTLQGNYHIFFTIHAICLMVPTPGLVRAFISMMKVTEAASIVREVYKLTQKNPQVLTLYGIVLSHLPQTRETVLL